MFPWNCVIRLRLQCWASEYCFLVTIVLTLAVKNAFLVELNGKPHLCCLLLTRCFPTTHLKYGIVLWVCSQANFRMQSQTNWLQDQSCWKKGGGVLLLKSLDSSNFYGLSYWTDILKRQSQLHYLIALRAYDTMQSNSHQDWTDLRNLYMWPQIIDPELLGGLIYWGRSVKCEWLSLLMAKWDLDGDMELWKFCVFSSPLPSNIWSWCPGRPGWLLVALQHPLALRLVHITTMAELLFLGQEFLYSTQFYTEDMVLAEEEVVPIGAGINYTGTGQQGVMEISLSNIPIYVVASVPRGLCVAVAEAGGNLRLAELHWGHPSWVLKGGGDRSLEQLHICCDRGHSDSLSLWRLHCGPISLLDLILALISSLTHQPESSVPAPFLSCSVVSFCCSACCLGFPLTTLQHRGKASLGIGHVKQNPHVAQEMYIKTSFI